MMQEFTRSMKNMMSDTIRNIHTIIPGKIDSYDPDKCTASILPYGNFKKPDGSFISYPKLTDVPIYVVQGSGQTATIVIPINKDDECLVLFSEQSLDMWRTKASSNTDLRFDLTNAIAIVGMFSKPNPLMKIAAQQDAIIIDRNGSRITLSPDNKIDIAGNVTISSNLTVHDYE